DRLTVFSLANRKRPASPRETGHLPCRVQCRALGRSSLFQLLFSNFRLIAAIFSSLALPSSSPLPRLSSPISSPSSRSFLPAWQTFSLFALLSSLRVSPRPPLCSRLPPPSRAYFPRSLQFPSVFRFP